MKKATVELDWIDLILLIDAYRDAARQKRHCTVKHDRYCKRIGELKRIQKDLSYYR